MKYILEGPQAEVVVQENRNRIAMGMVKITPVADEAEDAKDVAPVKDTKEVPATDEKKPAKKTKK